MKLYAAVAGYGLEPTRVPGVPRKPKIHVVVTTAPRSSPLLIVRSRTL